MARQTKRWLSCITTKGEWPHVVTTLIGVQLLLLSMQVHDAILTIRIVPRDIRWR